MSEILTDKKMVIGGVVLLFILGFVYLLVTQVAQEVPEVLQRRQQQQQTQQLASYNDFLEKVRVNGYEPALTETIELSVLPFKAYIIKIAGEEMKVFDFVSMEDADNFVSGVSPDGSTVNGAVINWPGTPHFYRSGKVIVQYAGSYAAVLSLLNSIMGPQFAGQ